MGRAINKTVMVVELIKRRIVGLHQNTTTGSTDITDMWEPLEEGLLPLETTRHVSMITITLSKKELDTSSIGYAYCTLLSAAFNDFLCQFVLTKFYGFLCHELTSRYVKSVLTIKGAV
ncbi:ribonuclease P protein subunit p25-like protein [Zea mays]|uniref:ribonuclease P protein subunit p25-like protein n=1 Tax=Zea mays TaxID=4577 RepID=UPI0009A97FA7|nr:ribonuclease P protein subunit p25-like protein [Zea mays]|eukprot:XP_008676084.2 ribonuclease P protein subunit p25-like protein [Zea mays]